MDAVVVLGIEVVVGMGVVVWLQKTTHGGSMDKHFFLFFLVEKLATDIYLFETPFRRERLDQDLDLRKRSL